MKASDYCVPIYLNQGVVFDLLAIVEDGLAHVSTIKTAETNKTKGEASVGATNVFALLGIGLKAERGDETNREIVQERVHTPVSLFAKVRAKLAAEKVVKDLTTSNYSLTDITSGSFVELELTLRRNPLIEALDAVVETIGAIGILSSFSELPAPGKNRKAAANPVASELKPVADHSKRIATALRTGGSLDLIGPVVGSDATALLTVETRYFAENWADEIGSGRFRVFGKVIQNTSGTGEQISLLRNTQFAHMPNIMDPLKTGVQTANETGLRLPDVVTAIDAPALHILPIAIFL